MPLYDYKCLTCGKEFEYLQSIKDEPLKNCPLTLCREEKKGEGLVERKISRNVGLVFKGNGFYLTDYVRKGNDGNTSLSKSAENVSKIVDKKE